MLNIYLEAPFGVFRNFTAGSYRPSAHFITYSAAYGLLLNIAGIEMRVFDEKQPMTLIKDNLPKCLMAIGALSMPEVHTVFQQLHNYPVGNTRKEWAPQTKGNKYNIIPVKREFLSGLKAFICIKDNDELEKEILAGLTGMTERSYGLPFLGDNNFLIDKLEERTEIKPVHWFQPLETEDTDDISHDGITRLTVSIDRADMSQTRSKLFALSKNVSAVIPGNSWQEVGY